MFVYTLYEHFVHHFYFWFISPKGNIRHFLPKQGRIDESGISLGGEMIYWEDIHGVEMDENRLIISLMPYCVLGLNSSEHIVPEHQCIVISVRGDDTFLLKTGIDRRISVRKAKQRIAGMSEDEIAKKFRYMNCPRCDALIDLTDYPQTFYVFCPYCHALADKHNTPLAGYENYRVCPECNFFGKVADFEDYHYYKTLQKGGFYHKHYYCCDACAENFFKKNIIHNLSFVVGAIMSVYQRIKARQKRHHSFEDLHKANRYALMGAVNEAKNIYYSILLRLPHHPGIHYNLGYMYFRIGDKKKASFYFEKCIQQCGNYLPLIQLLKKYESVVMEEEKKVE